MIVGTAGHIDHGKTSLVRVLTGIDTDRLKEEKTRGMTIELGFAYLPRPGGHTIGFVDAPGHGRLVHTMLAGATGIDFVLLVVACDDGVMPQTREHLAIIDLLGLRQGVVALTKCDLVAQERIAEVTAQVRADLSRTGLTDVQIMPVSAVTAAGIESLMRVLDESATQGHSRPADKRFRLAVDRVFSLAGAGTVATGTVLSGHVAVGDSVVVSPSGLEARVRSIHAQNRNAQHGWAGQRCALALVGSGIDAASVARGDVVLDPSLHQPVGQIDVRVKLLASERKALSQWLPIKFHHGSAESDAKIQVLRSHALAPGEEDFARIVLHEPLAMSVGDRFVVRDTSATRTMGGGSILDLAPPQRHRASPQRRKELDHLGGEEEVAVLRNLLEVRGYMDLGAFFRDRASLPAMVDAASRALDLVTFEVGRQSVALLPDAWARYTTAVVEALEAFHTAHPDLPGLGQERLRLTTPPRLPAVFFSVVLRRLSADGHVTLDRWWVRRPCHVVRVSDEEERIWAQIVPLLQGAERFRPPRLRDVATAQKLDERFVRRLFKMAARRGDIDEIAKDHFFTSDAVVEMADIACELAAKGKDGKFTVINFRDRLDIGRKLAIQILEFFDRQGLTMRRSDIRRINPHRRELFSRSTPHAETPPREGGETFPVGRPDFKSGEDRETVLGGFDSCLLRQPGSEAGA